MLDVSRFGGGVLIRIQFVSPPRGLVTGVGEKNIREEVERAHHPTPADSQLNIISRLCQRLHTCF